MRTYFLTFITSLIISILCIMILIAAYFGNAILVFTVKAYAIIYDLNKFNFSLPKDYHIILCITGNFSFLLR